MGECEGKDIQLIASPATAGNTYTWDCPNPIYNGTSGPFLFIPMSSCNDSGEYTLTVTDSMGCISSAVEHVNVIPKPVVSITGPGFACLGTKTYLFANDMVGNYGPYTYSWETGSTTQSIKILHNGGTYPHPSCVLTNGSGCSASNQTAYMIGTLYPPVAEITYNGLTSFCAPQTLLLSATPGAGLFYQWRKSGKNINGANGPTFNAAGTGNFRVIVADLNGCSDTSDLVPVNVYPLPSGGVTASGPMTFCAGDSVTLTAMAGAGFAYQWRRNGIPVPGANNLSYTIKNPGSYKVEITSDHDCVKVSTGRKVTIACREADIADADPLKITAFPNPASDHFTLRINSTVDGPILIQLFDILGKEVLSMNNMPSNADEINIGNALLPGIYSARVSQSDLVRVIKLVKN